jgi:hypothetical protein
VKRIACLAGCGLAVALIFTLPQISAASPFRDVPSNHWAIDYIQTLAADGIIQGYPNGKFEGGNDMTRYEMAAIIARAVAYVQANGASASDVDKLQKLMDAYKDELDALGVRVSTLEDKMAALDRATQFAQRFNVHGLAQNQYSERERTLTPTEVDGVTLAYKDPVQKFTDAFIETDGSNDPYYGNNGPAVYLPRIQWDITPQYAVTPNVLLSIPIHIVDFSYGGVRQQQVGYGINPTIDVTVPDITDLKGATLKIGQLTNLDSSLTGLTYSPPDNLTIAFKDPYRPYPMGVDIGGTAFNWVDFQGFGYRVDPVLINTGAFGPNTGVNISNSYLGPYYPQQTTNVYSSSLTTDTFPNSAASMGVITNVYLSQLATPGTIYISYLLGPGCPTGCTFTGPGQGQPSFSYVQTLNEVVFSSPLPAGSQVSLTYQGSTVSNNTLPQRYDVGGRAVYRVPGIGNGAGTIGVTFNRLFDVPSDSILNASYPGTDVTLVSDTVFGLDFVLPIAYAIGPIQTPAIFGETATSKYSPDYQHVPAQSDTAGVIGLRFKILGGDQTIVFQNVGPNYIDGAPFQYSGQAPAIFSFYNYPYVPGPFGIGNDLGLTQQVDRLAAAAGYTGPSLAGNTSFPYGTFAFPLFNQFKASGPYFYSTFAPNTSGESVQLNFPLTIGGVDAKLNIGGQELREIRPESLAVDIFGPEFVSTMRAKYDQLGGGLTLGVPLWDRKATVTLNGLFEQLQRPDKTPFIYAADPTLALTAPVYNPVASAELTGTGSEVLFYPNYVNVQHTLGRAQLALPVTAALTANLDYIDQHYTGEALNTLSQSISERKLSLTGGVLYNIPNTNASVNLSFNRYEYHDDNVSTYDWVQNRQNLYFSVKF